MVQLKRDRRAEYFVLGPCGNCNGLEAEGWGELLKTEFSSYVPNLNFQRRYIYVLYNENLIILKALWANITYVHLCSIISSSICKFIFYIQHQLNSFQDIMRQTCSLFFINSNTFVKNRTIEKKFKGIVLQQKLLMKDAVVRSISVSC